MTPLKEQLPLFLTALGVAAGLGLTPVQAAGLKNGDYTGRTYSAYYGYVQVRAEVRNGTLAKVDVLRHPNDRFTSRIINARALPVLEREVIRAQSAQVRFVSGASLTSNAFLHSLQSALKQAS